MNKINYNWILKASLFGFFIAIIFSVISELTLKNVNIFWGSLVVLFFIIFGVLADMIGTAVTAVEKRAINSMAADKIAGGQVAVSITKNASQVASFLNDIIGDICGIISGSAGIIIAIAISIDQQINVLIPTLIITALISALTIGGKALGKELALKKSTKIVHSFAIFLEKATKK